MSVPLATLRDSFEGVIPSVVATLDAQGMPNVSTLSHVYYVDARHVALSNQFFSKTVANVRARGTATVIVVDPRTGAQHVLDLRFVRAEAAGPLFARMDAHLKVMSAGQGMEGVMRLRSADIYEVLEARPVVWSSAPSEGAPRDRLAEAAAVAAALAGAHDADAVIDAALDGLASTFGFGHVMLLVADEAAAMLHAVASRGYDRPGVGAEVAVGEGIIGISAATRLPLRIADLGRGNRYVSAVRAAAAGPAPHTIPLAGLARPVSQLAVPMVCRGRLSGVLFAEAEAAFAFGHAEEEALLIVAAQLAAGLRLAELEGRDAGPAPAAPAAAAPRRVVRIRHFPFDDAVFVEGDYLIKGVPGRLLVHFLKALAATGSADFTNRALRRDPSLRLPDIKDNLETRLILLRRRLEEKAAPIRLLRPERGRVRLEVDGVPEIEVAGQG